MPTANDYTEQQLIPTLGMYALPYATTWPELAQKLRELYIGRAGTIDWLPQDWLGTVLSLHAQNGMILVPAPSSVRPGIPWLRNAAQRAWWDDLAARAGAVISTYAAGKAEEGRALLAKLYADADFWNKGFGASLISAQQFAYDVRDRAKDVVDSPGKYLAIAGVVGAGLLLLALRRR